MLTLHHLDILDADLDGLRAIADDGSPSEVDHIARRLPEAAGRARAVSGHWDFTAPARMIDAALPLGDASDDAARAKARLRRIAVARLALGFFEVREALPPSVIALFPAFFARLASFLRRMRGAYDDEFYAKDVRYALGLTIPCGAMQIDLNGKVGPKLILRDVIASRSLGPALAYVAARGWGRWYNDHLDLRAMETFDAAGWTDFFQRVVEVLELNPDVRGVAGASWFYDPEVVRISPEMAYVQMPARFGAFRASMGTADHHVQNATLRSKVRRSLYEEGRYRPTCFLLAWPRGPLIRWARRMRSEPDLAFERFNPQPLQA